MQQHLTQIFSFPDKGSLKQNSGKKNQVSLSLATTFWRQVYTKQEDGGTRISWENAMSGYLLATSAIIEDDENYKEKNNSTNATVAFYYW